MFNAPRHVRRQVKLLAYLMLSTALLPVLHPSMAGERSASMGVSLRIIAGCSVSGSPGTAIIVACTNEIPYQLGVFRGVGDATLPSGQEPHVSVTADAGADAINVITVTY